MPFIKLTIPPGTPSSSQSSILTPPPSTPELSISSSVPSDDESQSSYDEEIESEPKEEIEPDQEVFYVSRIIARSIPTDGIPYYLVRWWGYGPAEDTWEPSHSLRKTASELVDTFDKHEHPFTILDSKDDKLHIRYGWSSRQQGYSPHAEVVWQTREEMGLMGITVESIQSAEVAWKSGDQPNPTILVATPKQPKKPKPKPKVARQAKKGYKLLAIIEEMPGSKRSGPRCFVEYKKGRAKPVVQWFSRNYAYQIFGKDQMDAARIKQAEEVEIEVEDPSQTMYEDERARNMAENKKLLADLGL